MIEGLNKLVQTASNSTEAFAHEYGLGNKSGIDPYVKAAILLANELGLGINAGHDLSLDNIRFKENIPDLLEVSIGHAFTLNHCILD
jgi:pyridoxine 5-phosphate synthase